LSSSVFSRNRIEERGIPSIVNVKKLLKTELGVECKTGATYGQAYCGVVGGTDRHEYSILGSPVNLAARLMGSPQNPGILVDEAVMKKAGSRPFLSLPPVNAKGYDHPVKIYKPKESIRKSWKEVEGEFVGREDEVISLVSHASGTREYMPSSVCALLFAPYGAGKSCLLSHAATTIEKICAEQSKTCHTTRHVFCEEDSFKPFSIVRPILMDLLTAMHNKSNGGGRKVETIGGFEAEQQRHEQDMMNARLLHVCLSARIPLSYVEVIGGLIFTDKLSDIGTWADKGKKLKEWNKIADQIVTAIAHMIDPFDFTLLALDDVGGMDEMSWRIVDVLCQRCDNLLVVGAARNLHDTNMPEDLWDKLDEPDCKSVIQVNLSPMSQDEVRQLVENRLGKSDEGIARTVFIQSEGNPLMASEITDKLYKNKDTKAHDLGDVAELLLNRLDSLNPSVRSCLNLGAILGETFAFDDVVAIMERYEDIKDEEKISHAEHIRESLEEAKDNGILGSAPDSGTFEFIHPFWRGHISKNTLDEWKASMLGIAENLKKEKEHLLSTCPEQKQKYTMECLMVDEDIDQLFVDLCNDEY